MYKITFVTEEGSRTEAFANDEETILSVAQKSNVPIDAPCSGNASCGKCRVKIISGEVESRQTRHITDEDYAAGWRLACASKVIGDVTVEVPDIASAYKSRMRVADLSSPAELKIFRDATDQVKKAGIAYRNNMDIIEIRMDAPTLDDTRPDNERVVDAIEKKTGIGKVRLPYSVMRKMAHVLRVSDFHVKCVVRTTGKDVFVYDMLPASVDVVIGGLAVDIGTTTVSAVLLNMKTGEILGKASSGNGQIRYGADVINRIIESQKPGGGKRLQDAVIKETINPLIQEICRAA